MSMKMNSPRLIIAALALAAFACGAQSAVLPPTPTTQKPNIIVILVDDMGYGDIGSFGSKLNRTPNLDRLASEGMRLTSFYCAPYCTASRAQLMTGCYSKRVGLADVLFEVSSSGLNPAEKTIAALLKPQGYATMIIGKWHLGDQPEFLPTRHGFDHYLGLPYSHNLDRTDTPDFAARNKSHPLPLLRDEKVIQAPPDLDKLEEMYTEEAVKFITANKDHPFFLYLPHSAVHTPLHPGAAFKGKSKNGLYGDWVEEVDWSTGRVMDTLKELKLDQNTLVIFTSDNGGVSKEASNAPLRGSKGSTWEGGLREPTIAWWPGRIAAGSTCDAMVSEMDVLPTVVCLAGGQVPTDRKIDGLDIWPILSGQSKDSPHEAICYFLAGSLRAVRSGSWKLAIADQKKRIEKGGEAAASVQSLRLYNLDRDIGETTDVAAQNPDVVKRMQALIAEMDADLGIDRPAKDKSASGIRPAGRVGNPKHLLMRVPTEYD